MERIYTRLPYVGEVEAVCAGEPVRCLVRAILGDISGRYAWFRARKQYAALKRATSGAWVKVDLNAAYVYALRKAHEGKVCVDHDGYPVDCELCPGCAQWSGWVDFARWAYLRSLAEEVDRSAYTVIVGTHSSEWAVYWQFGDVSKRCRRVAYTYASLVDAVYALYKSGCRGVVVRTRDVLKYGVLTNIGYTYWTGDAWVFQLAVSLTTDVLLRSLERADWYAAYVDSVIARDYVGMPWPHKVEDEVERGLLVLPVVYAGNKRWGLWMVGNCDAREREEVRSPWRVVERIVERGEAWLYEWSMDALKGRVRPKCWRWVNEVRVFAERAGVKWDPVKRTVRDARAGMVRSWEGGFRDAKFI